MVMSRRSVSLTTLFISKLRLSVLTTTLLESAEGGNRRRRYFMINLLHFLDFFVYIVGCSVLSFLLLFNLQSTFLALFIK